MLNIVEELYLMEDRQRNLQRELAQQRLVKEAMQARGPKRANLLAKAGNRLRKMRKTGRKPQPKATPCSQQPTTDTFTI